MRPLWKVFTQANAQNKYLGLRYFFKEYMCSSDLLQSPDSSPSNPRKHVFPS